MPFVPSSAAEFEPDAQGSAATDYRVNGTWEVQAAQDGFAGAAYRNDMHAAFVAYMARSDIESRSSILARENAEPGTIFWSQQTEPGQVDVVSDGTEAEV